MKTVKYIFMNALLLVSAGGCIKQTFYPDIDNPGLSRFTSQHFNAGSCYINDTPYVNYWVKASLFGHQLLPELIKIETASVMDSLDFRWQIGLKKGKDFTEGRYRTISIRIPVPKDFTRQDFMSWNDKIFTSDVNTLVLNDSLKGAANIYFVKITANEEGTNIYVSGLFDGYIGNDIFVKNGRFDYLLNTDRF